MKRPRTRCARPAASAAATAASVRCLCCRCSKRASKRCMEKWEVTRESLVLAFRLAEHQVVDEVVRAHSRLGHQLSQNIAGAGYTDRATLRIRQLSVKRDAENSVDRGHDVVRRDRILG